MITSVIALHATAFPQMSEQPTIDNAASLIRRADELSRADEVEVLLVIGNNDNYFILNTFDQAVPLASILVSSTLVARIKTG